MTPIETKQEGFFHAFKDEILLFAFHNQRFRILKGQIRVENEAEELTEILVENSDFNLKESDKNHLIAHTEIVIFEKID